MQTDHKYIDGIRHHVSLASRLIAVHPETASIRFAGPDLVVDVEITATDRVRGCREEGVATVELDGNVTWKIDLPEEILGSTHSWSVPDAIVPGVREAAAAMLKRVRQHLQGGSAAE